MPHYCNLEVFKITIIGHPQNCSLRGEIKAAYTGAMKTSFLVALLNGLVATFVWGGEMVNESFDSENQRRAWQLVDGCEWVCPQLGSNTFLKVSAKDANMVAIVRKIDLRPFAGMKIAVTADLRLEGVTKPAHEWNGVKCMLVFETPTTSKQWCSLSNVYGTEDWKSYGYTCEIPPDATTGEWVLGLQESAGTVFFDNLAIRENGRRAKTLPPPRAFAEPPYRGHAESRLRGCMISPVYDREGLETLHAWGANLVRFQITRDDNSAEADLDAFERRLHKLLGELEKMLPDCERLGIKVVIDLHSPPGGRLPDRSMAMFYQQDYADRFVETWQKIARQFKGRPAVWAYDLINEPVQNIPVPPGLQDYWDLQIRAAQAIREIDPETAIIFEVDNWDSASGFRFVEPVPVSNVVYQVHLYNPHEFTHQNVNDVVKPLAYPGTCNGAPLNREYLRKILKPVRDFQLAYNVQIYAGEFSAARWAPGAADYLRDCIDLFEEYGWDWSYHAFREWDGWSVEHGSDKEDRKPVSQDTDRKKVLVEAFHRP